MTGCRKNRCIVRAQGACRYVWFFPSNVSISQVPIFAKSYFFLRLKVEGSSKVAQWGLSRGLNERGMPLGGLWDFGVWNEETEKWEHKELQVRGGSG